MIECETLAQQIEAQAADLPELPLVLGGCCCAHVGAIRGLAARPGRLAVVWLDAHGDLNTPESSPSGNAWGMPLRMAIDEGAVRAEDVALVGARSLDPPEEAFLDADGDRRRHRAGARRVRSRLRRARLRRAPARRDRLLHAGARRAVVAEVEVMLRDVVADRLPIAGFGLTGLGRRPTSPRSSGSRGALGL